MAQADAHNRVMVSVPGVTKEVAELEMLAATREFFKRSGAWHGVLTMTTVAGQTIYALTPTAGREVSMVDQVLLDGAPMRPLPDVARPYELAGLYYVYDVENDRLVLQEDPGAGGELLAYVWYRPIALANVPAFAWENFENELVAGTLCNLFQQPGKPYTNPALAAVNHRKFNSGIAQARRRALSSNTRSDIGWMFPLATRSRNLRG